MDRRELENILKSVMDGRFHSLERLTRGYLAPLMELGRRLGLNDTEAEAAARDVFLRIYREASTRFGRQPAAQRSDGTWLMELYLDEARQRLARLSNRAGALDGRAAAAEQRRKGR